MQNGKVVIATQALVAMQSLETGPNPQVPIGQAIPNFPPTPNDITRLNGTLPLPVLPLSFL